MLSDPRGAPIADGEGVGTIINDDPIPAAWNARFGRTVADQVLDAVEARMGNEPMPGLDVTLAGERLEWTTSSGETATATQDKDGTRREPRSQPVAQQAVAQLAQWLTLGNGETGDVALRRVNGRELLATTSFALTGQSSGGGLFSFWGRGAVTHFDGREGELTLDGE